MHRLFLFLLTGFFAGIAFGVSAEEPPPVVEIKNAYAFATASTQENGAVFLTVVNYSEDDSEDGAARFTAAHTDVADIAEFHTMEQKDGGVMEMRQVAALEVPPASTVVLEPTGNHIMLMGLRVPLQIGEHFQMTLTLEHWGDIDVNVEIVAPGAKPGETE